MPQWWWGRVAILVQAAWELWRSVKWPDAVLVCAARRSGLGPPSLQVPSRREVLTGQGTQFCEPVCKQGQELVLQLKPSLGSATCRDYVLARVPPPCPIQFPAVYPGRNKVTMPVLGPVVPGETWRSFWPRPFPEQSSSCICLAASRTSSARAPGLPRASLGLLCPRLRPRSPHPCRPRSAMV